MKGYKAFRKGFICRGKQYAENTIFEEEKAEIRKSGMHFCKNPLDVLDCYPLIDNNGDLIEFAEVVSLDECKTDDGKRFCTKKLKIGAKLSLKDFIKTSFFVTYNNIKDGVISCKNGGYNTVLAGGDYATLAGGYYSVLAGGYNATLAGGADSKLVGGNNAKLAGGADSKLVGGNNAKLAGGYNAVLAGGDNATLAGGDYAKLAGGNNATLAGGYNAKLAGGDYATLAGGDYATLAGGTNAVLVGGNGSFAKGKKGTVIVLFEKDGNGNITDFRAEQVDGVRIKEDVLYRLKDGEFMEVDKNNA